MDRLIISRHDSLGARYRIIELHDDSFFSVSEEARKQDTVYSGVYYETPKGLIIVFSLGGNNYLCIPDKIYMITPSIQVEYYCSSDMKEFSWIKVLENGNVVFEVSFPTSEPFINPFDGFEDWEINNLGYNISMLVQKAHEETVLFS